MAAGYELYRDMEQVAHDAGPALDRATQPWMFDRVEWFRLVARHTPEGQPLVVKASNGAARCWLFLARNGGSVAALSNWYCLRYGVVSDGAGPPPLDKLVAALRKEGIHHVRLDPTGEEDALVSAFRKAGWLVRREQVNVSWRIDTSGMDFEAYWAGRPSRLRNTAKRKARKAKLDFAMHQRFDANAWADLVEVFDASWKKPEGSPELIRDLVRQEGDAGTLRMGLAYKDGQAVAAQIWTVENGVAIIHKLAYREDAKRLGAGTVLSVEMFRHVLDTDRVAMIDFGIGNDSYKREWMTHSVPLYSLTAYDCLSLAGLADLAKVLGRKLAKRVFRRGNAADGE